MKNAPAVLAALVGAAAALPSGQKAPKDPAPEGCRRTAEGAYQLNIIAPVETETGSKNEVRQLPGN